MRSLETVLDYSNPAIIERFSRKFSVSQNEAEEVFQETLKLLWLMALRKKEQSEGETVPAKILLYKQMTVLDEMWHNFMLFSREYTEFCQSHFGHYLHHSPTTFIERAQEEEKKNRDPEGHRRSAEREVGAQCRYILEKLGEETLSRWFKEFPERFPRFVP